MSNKNIDRLFQENLKDLEATPNKKVWNAIEAKLTNKKSKIVPFWWISSSIAALLIVSLFIFPFSDNNNKLEFNNDVVITNSSKEENESQITPKSDSILPYKKVTHPIQIANDKTINKKQNVHNKQQVKKEVVSTKNAMKKIFLAKNSKTQNRTTKKAKMEISKKNIAKKSAKEKNKNKNLNKKKPFLKKVDIASVTITKDTITIEEPKTNKWAIAPVFGVLNSNSFSDTSPIQESLSNAAIGQNSLSFGVQVGYRIHEKWTIQTGIHRQEISYAHNKINVVASVPSRNSSVTLNERVPVTFESFSQQTASISSDIAVNSINLNGDLSQTFGYIEIPIEIKYHFLSSKNFDSQVVAGFSSLFLNKNEVNFNTPFQTEMGRTNNLNSINFSGNIGLDLSYLISKKWSFNINPMFKAQLNMFTDNANGFAPFNIGVYTGIKYRF